jgi:hypothetical protein
MKLALPDAQNRPAIFSKHSRHNLVTRHIVAKLWKPEFQSAFWCICKFAPLMSMPKAAIYENGNLVAGKNKIWFAKHSGVSPPANDAMLAEQRYQPQLSIPVPPPTD